MKVVENNDVTKWIGKKKDGKLSQKYDNIIESAESSESADNIEGWRHVGGANNIYDSHLSGDWRLVGEVSGDQLEVKAIYNHPKGGGKKKLAGEEVANY